MKIYLKILLAIIFASALMAGPVLAAPNINDLTSQIAQKSGYQTAGVTDTTLSQTVGMIISIVLGLVGMIFLALTVYAGFLWMTAAGDEEPITKAKKILTTSVIGLVIVLAAYSITYFVTNYLYSATSPTGNVVGGYDETTVEGINGARGCCFSTTHQCDPSYGAINLPNSGDPQRVNAENQCIKDGGSVWNNCANPCP
ncbi:MAG: pilin [Patescibacteria group bacterium]